MRIGTGSTIRRKADLSRRIDMNRRDFLIATGGAAAALGAPSAGTATVLYEDGSVKLDKVRPDPKDLWVRSSDLPRINQFELKPQGACRADMCIPVSKDLKSGEWFNLTGFARKVSNPVVPDPGGWSCGELPEVRCCF